MDSVSSAEEALAIFVPEMHDAVLTDNRMPGMTGLEMAQRIKARSPATPVIMHTGVAPEERAGLDVVLQKPVPLRDLKQVLDQLLAPPAAA